MQTIMAVLFQNGMNISQLERDIGNGSLSSGLPPERSSGDGVSTYTVYTGTGTYNMSTVAPTSPQFKSVEHLVLTSVFLGLMILATIIGNVFVIAAIILEKNLHSVANYLILSLAVADLMVASLVMPISVVNEVSQVWFLRPEICDMWISFDVLCCTASILHLVAISVDRYWAVTDLDYIRTRSARRILIMIALSWGIGICISIPPLFGWKDHGNSPEVSGMCIISQDIGYTIFSTFGAFYLPTIAMMIIYAKIFLVARSRIRRKDFHKRMQKMQQQSPIVKQSLQQDPQDTTSRNNLLVNSPQLNGHRNKHLHLAEEVTINETSCNGETIETNDKNDNSKVQINGGFDDNKLAMLPKTNKEASKAKRAKEKMEAKRERKAARTLGIITGAYIVCWLPFFICALTGPMLGDPDAIPATVFSLVLWLGYFNSLLNPVLYTIFNPDFRNAFKKILFGKYRRRKYRR